MPSFQCKVCGESFDIAQQALDKYPGWQPKYCRTHSPKKGARKKASPREENLTRKQRVELALACHVEAELASDGKATLL